MMYQILSNKLVQKQPVTRRVVLLIEQGMSLDEFNATIQAAADDLLTTCDLVVMYVYQDAQAVAWNGYIATVTARIGQQASARFDNNPELRRALFRSLR